MEQKDSCRREVTGAARGLIDSYYATEKKRITVFYGKLEPGGGVSGQKHSKNQLE